MAHQTEARTNSRGKTPDTVDTMGTKAQRGRDPRAEQSELEPVPGSRQVSSPGMVDYLVTLKNEPSPSKLTRREVYDSGLARSSEFLERLRQRISEQDLWSEVGALGQPTAFPMISITCTPRVASMIESVPDVESVFRDSKDIQFVR
jgi:hypothetical protein